jgi:hypothetical protein
MSEFDKLRDIAAETDAAAVIAAAEDWKRNDGDLSPEHAGVLIKAVLNLRGEFIQTIERKALAYWRSAGEGASAEGQTYLMPLEDEMRQLFRADIEQVVREAGGTLW